MQRLLNDEPSLLKGGMPEISRLWKVYAKEYLGVTKTLKGKVIFVNYNLWTQDSVYRTKLAKTLGYWKTGSLLRKFPATLWEFF